MRVLWLVRDDLTRQPGGDTTQILQTAEHLRALGVEVELTSAQRPSLAEYDVLHLWHLDRLWENEPRCRRIRREGRPAVLSTIYWPADDYDHGGRTGLQGAMARAFGSDCYRSLRLLQRWGMATVRGAAAGRISWPTWSFRRSAQRCLRTVRVLLPNSVAEREVIERTLGIARPTVVVPNAVGQAFLSHEAGPWPGDRRGVICVGRIEPRKNQLALIRAVSGTSIELTLIGQAGRFSQAYYERCRAEAGANVRFVGQVDAEALRGWYGRSLVHVCPSWYETPGLVNLEAAVCGCAVVATPGGCVREYLGEDAYYCATDNVASMRQAIEAALSGGPRPALVPRIKQRFTWAAAAEKTLEAYRLCASAK